MLKLLATPMRNFLSTFNVNEKAQDAFEYLLVIGGVSVLVITAMVTPVGTNMINAVVAAVQTAVLDVIA